jgi:hypothetical protein
MKSLRDNFGQWSNGCQTGLKTANISSMVPGTSTSSGCANVLYSQPLSGSGKLKAVTLQITPLEVIVTFVASRPWDLVAVVKGDNKIQWSFTEWVPHHRPIIDDNHGGTAFPPARLAQTSVVGPSRYVYFKHSNQSVSGAYAYSSTKLVLTYQVASLRMLGVKTPFTWAGSEGFQKCSAVIAK